MPGFAAEVIRPAAAKHDAEESTPWEVIKAARERGLHGIEHLQRLAAIPTGRLASSTPRSSTGAAPASRWRSRARSLAAAGLASSGTPEQIAKWVPECFGDRR